LSMLLEGRTMVRESSSDLLV